MHIVSRRTWAICSTVVLAMLIGSVLLVSAEKPRFTVHDKAYYKDANLVAFVRPGLSVTIESAQIAADGTITVQFKLADPKGLPLDREGIYTPGTVNTGMIAAYIPAGQTQYTAYTTRTQTSPITGVSAVQASSDSGGTYQKINDGEYIYTFKTKAPAGYDRTATHTIGIYANRNLTEFDLGTDLADTTFNFVPDGSAVTVVRDVVKTATCNKCHQNLHLHGETGRKSVEDCILCHTPQTTDPDTGNTVDMKVMIHKIHRGEDLPSVQAGTPYQIIGFRQTVVDFSTVVFPAYDTRNCTFCHEQGIGTKQEAAYLKPSRAVCGSCHDDVDFDTGQNHVNLPQFSDNQCQGCHPAQGEYEFDVSVTGAHTIPTHAAALPGTTFSIVKVEGAGPGKQPTITFTLRDKSGKAILPSDMTRLRLVLAGPTSDYNWQVREDATKAQGTADGTYTWTTVAPLPDDAAGTYAVGIEGYRNITLLPGTLKEQVARDAGLNQVFYFSVDGSPIEPRRTVVSRDNCNKCHFDLSLHGGNRNQPEQCVLCHRPGATTSDPPVVSINLTSMVHRIHTGENLTFDFTIGDTSFNDVLFPGDRRNCDACHVNNSQQLPLSSKLLDVADPSGPLNPIKPTASACTGCHTDIYAASHALVNTTSLGESCAVCHGPDGEFSVDKVHAE